MHQTPIKSIKHSRILLSPLNWGLGHASRTISIIDCLLDNKNEVIICCDENQERFYRNYFPEIWYVPHEGYPFKFNGKGNWTIDMLRNFGSLHLFLKEEKRKVVRLVEKFNPDLIISDQRFGFISKTVKSIIISHQLNLPVPQWNFLAKLWNRKLLAAFDEIWIPDTPQQKYSGRLSTGNFRNKHFIGTCSRFHKMEEENLSEKNDDEEFYSYLGIISGPSPYNQKLLDLLIKKLEKTDKKSIIIVPKHLFDENFSSKNVKVIASPNHKKFIQLLMNSNVVISRSGYSTLMDLIETKNEAILIPTPGQAEQIYLSHLNKNNENWRFRTEEEFDKMQF